MNIKYQLRGHEYFGLLDSKEQFYKYTDGLIKRKEVDKNIIELDLDSDEYILKDIPQEFHKALSWMAYDQGHSAGEAEVRNYLRGYAGDLEDSIKAFEKRIRNEYCN